MRTSHRARVLLAAALLALAAVPAVGQSPTGPYRLGAGDQIQLNVLQQPELDRQLTIRPDGTAIIPLVGSLPVAGLTVAEAEELIRQRLRLFNRDISDVSVTITQYNALRVYMLGALNSPGTYTFDSPPTLWDAVRAAGGAQETANLGAVRLIRTVDGVPQSQTLDFSALLTGSGNLPQIALRSEDTIIIPSRDAPIAGPLQTGVQVFGGVGSPGTYSLTEPTRLLTVLMLAGGPIETGDLSKIWWVHQETGGRHRASRVDARLFLQEGSLVGNPLIHPGDTVRVPVRGVGFWRGSFPLLLSVLTSGTAIYIAATR